MILLCLLWFSVNTQDCATSSIQTPLELQVYLDGSLEISDYSGIALDSNLNQYLAFYITDSSLPHLSKINSNGDFVWAKKYPNLSINSHPNTIQLTNDESAIRLVGFIKTPNFSQIVEIATCKC